MIADPDGIIRCKFCHKAALYVRASKQYCDGICRSAYHQMKVRDAAAASLK